MNNVGLIFVAPALLLLGGCPLVDLEVDAPEVCISSAPIMFVGGDLEGEWSQQSASDLTGPARDMMDTMSRIGDTDSLELWSLDVRIRRDDDAAGTVDFVRALELMFHAPNSGLYSLLAFECEDCDVEAGELSVILPPLQVLDYVRAPALELHATVRGELPPQSWSMNIDACFRSRSSRTFSP